MKIKFNRSQFIGDRTYAKGESADVADDVAARLIEDGTAVPVKGAGKTETATQPDAGNETAVVPDLTPKA
jgi:hypothetical protein